MDRTDEDRAAIPGFTSVPHLPSLLVVVCDTCAALVPEGGVDMHRRFHTVNRIGLA